LERLKAEVTSFKEDKEELIELRNLAYNQSKIDFKADETNIEEMAGELNKKKIVICGGHPNMHHKLKERIPELVTIETEALGKNLSHLARFDVVYYYPNYANHSFYKKVKSTIRNSKTIFAYLQDVDNIEFIIFKMYESINDKNLSV
jgi:organic radical activating enzyme